MRGRARIPRKLQPGYGWHVVHGDQSAAPVIWERSSTRIGRCHPWGRMLQGLKVEYIYNEKYASTNNIYSLWLTKDKIRGERILLLDSDILFDPLLVKAVLDCPDTTCLALNDHPLSEEEIKVIPDAQGKVAEISKTCSIGKAIGESIGIEKMSGGYTHALVDELDRMILQENQVNIFYEAAFERLIAQGHTFGIVDTTSFFSMELDTVADFQQAIDKIPAHLL